MKRIWIISPIIFSLVVYTGILHNPAPAITQASSSTSSSWEQIQGNQPTPRTGMSIARIGNDVYIYGGTNGEAVFEDLWQYNYAVGWHRITFTAPTLIPRYGHTAVGFYDEMAILLGKQDFGDFIPSYLPGSLNDIYDPQTNTLSRAPSGATAPGGRIYASATPLNDRIWLYGGKTGDDVQADIWSYNPTSGAWSDHSYYPLRPRYGHVAVPYKGKIYVFGGHDGDEAKGELRCFDPATHTWTTIATYDGPEALYLSAREYYLEEDSNAQRDLTAAQAGGRMWLAGGKNNNDEDVANVWEFNFATNHWRELTPLPEPRSNAGLTVFPNPDGTATLLVFGGERDGVPIAETMAMTVTLPPTYTVYLPLVMR